MIIFFALAMPYGWPQNSFFINATRTSQILVISSFFICCLVPILVSCVFYILIYCSVVVKKVNVVGIIEETVQDNTAAENQVKIS